MKKNMGNLDKVIRLLLALAIFGLSLAGVISGTLEIVLLIIAAIFILTSLIGFCPLYLPFKIKTNKKEIEGAKQAQSQV